MEPALRGQSVAVVGVSFSGAHVRVLTGAHKGRVADLPVSVLKRLPKPRLTPAGVFDRVIRRAEGTTECPLCGGAADENRTFTHDVTCPVSDAKLMLSRLVKKR